METTKDTSGVAPSSPIPDLLLYQYELPPENANYFRKITRKMFVQDFGVQTLQYLPSGQLIVIIPLEMGPNTFVPIPFIVSTGCPGYFYFGSGAKASLTNLKAIRKEGAAYYLQGTLYGFRTSIDYPEVDLLPYEHESQQGEACGDCRLNVIGLKGIQVLNVLGLKVRENLQLPES